MKHLMEFRVSENGLGDQFLENMHIVLKNDKWIKGVDIKGNRFSEKGVRLINEIIEMNGTII